MAQVVLENIYKSFPRRRGDTASPASKSVTNPDGPAVATTAQDPLDAIPKNISVLRRINLTVEDGEFMVLVGPSGCGKSTLLRLIAGLETLTGGKIWVGDRLVNALPPKQRDIAMVFQSYALYPHMTVYDNLAFGLRRMPTASGSESARVPDSIAKDREKRTRSDRTLDMSVSVGGLTLSSSVLERLLTGVTRPFPQGFRYESKAEEAINHQVQVVAQMLQLDPLLQRLPKELSGGQKQRVALGRAMARNPQVFLMDEPLSNLDAKLRTETRAQIVNLQRQLGTTTIYVTHDQTEAMTMGDRIAVMNQGQIQQIAAPLDLYNRPANRFVAEFIGSPPMNFLSVQVKAPLLVHHPKFRLTLPERWESALQPYNGKTLTLGIRPEHLSLRSPAPKNLPVQIQRVEALGSDTYVTVTLGEHRLQARIAPDQAIDLGKEIWLAIDPNQIHLFDEETGEAIR